MELVTTKILVFLSVNFISGLLFTRLTIQIQMSKLFKLRHNGLSFIFFDFFLFHPSYLSSSCCPYIEFKLVSFFAFIGYNIAVLRSCIREWVTSSRPMVILH